MSMPHLGQAVVGVLDVVAHQTRRALAAGSAGARISTIRLSLEPRGRGFSIEVKARLTDTEQRDPRPVFLDASNCPLKLLVVECDAATTIVRRPGARFHKLDLAPGRSWHGAELV